MTYKQLTIEERYQIKAYLKTKMNPKEISIALGGCPEQVCIYLERHRKVKLMIRTQALQQATSHKPQATSHKPIF
ncbi:hypothetical protein MNBD_GAMMA03-258 [hydrothermal vent metagenome]|uniref:Transposase IS30-like HTH domain-containing protein n=1 Tax=hydrothermal vent metagenome TaxID=652676 RepID=A0A3B0WAP7_9ZZZZ